MNGPLPNRAVALVAQLGRTERLAKPHGQPQAKRDDRQQKLFAVVDGVVMIRDVFSASGTTNGFGICHKAPFLQLKICNSKEADRVIERMGIALYEGRISVMPCVAAGRK